MSALAFLLLVFALIGLIALLYYGLLCYPILSQKSKPPTYDVEKRYLLPLGTNLNNNSEVSLAPPIPVSAAEAKRREALDESYPSAPNSSQSPHEDDSFGSPDVSQDIDSSKHPLDEPDSAKTPRGEMSTAPVSQDDEPSRPEPSEKVPLLHGDEEDGLILCQPSVRSKNTGEPIPPVETVVYPIDQTTDTPQKENELPRKSNLSPVSVPVDVQHEPSHVKPESQLPDHVTVIISEPMKVPPQENMSVSHPPSHMIVTIPQPLNAPPLMVAPIYDEPSIEQSPSSLHQPLQSIVVPVNVIPAPIELETYQEPTANHQSDAYGWKEIEVPVTINPKPEAAQPQESACIEPVTQKSNRQVVVVVASPTSVLPSAPDLDPASPHATNDDDYCDSSNTSSNASPTVSPRSKGSCTLSESSDPELSEYTFESGSLCPSTKTVLENEISSVSNVKILRYTKIDDSVILEADASISDSIRVHVGDPVDLDDLQTESAVDIGAPSEGSPDEGVTVVVDTSCRTPDLAIARRSPDGVSMKSDEGDSSVGNSPKKTKEQGDSNVDNSSQKVEEQTVSELAKVL